MYYIFARKECIQTEHFPKLLHDVFIYYLPLTMIPLEKGHSVLADLFQFN